MRKVSESLLKVFIKPIQNHALFLLFLIILTSIIEPSIFFRHSQWARGFTIIAYNIIQCYIVVLVYNLLPKKLQGIARLLIFTYISIVQMFSYVTREVFDMPLHREIAAIVGGSNVSETYEFILTFATPWIVAGLLMYLLLPCIAEILLHYTKNNKQNILSKFLLVLIPSSLVYTFARPDKYESFAFFNQASIVSTVFNRTPDLKSNIDCINIQKWGGNPTNIVVIIGESFAKSTCSLYSYHKETSPKLKARRDRNELIIFNNVISPAGNTIPCMKAIMSVWRTSYGDSVPYQECIALPEVMKKAGYETYWISNQAKKGFWDNIPSKYSELCDMVKFTDNEYRGGFTKCFDEDVIPLLNDISNTTNCYFIHLLGQHPGPENRYPASFNKFQWHDYGEYPEHERWYRFHNDNATLYNDYVVDSIMNLFENKEAIIFYVPDHGLDIFEVDKYTGHGRSAMPESLNIGRQIPFMIYTTKLYRERFPNKIEKMKGCVDKPFNTEDFIYTIMDVANIRFSDNNDVEKYSLFAQ